MQCIVCINIFTIGQAAGHVGNAAAVDADVLIRRIKGNLGSFVIGTARNRCDAGQIISQFHIIGDFTGCGIRIAMKKNILTRILIFFRIGLRSAFYSESRMSSTGFFIQCIISCLQITEIHRICQPFSDLGNIRCTIQCTLYIGNSSAAFSGEGDLRLIHRGLAIIGRRIIFHGSVIHIGNFVRIALHLGIQAEQVRPGGIAGLHIFPIFGRTDFTVHRSAGNQLLTAIIIRHGAGTDSCSPGFLIVSNIRCISGGSVSFFQISADVGSVDACQFLDLCHVHGVRICGAGCYARNLAGNGAVCLAYGDCRIGGFPGCGGFARFRIIAGYLLINRSYRFTADGHAAIFLHIGVMADDYGVRSSQFLLSISRTDDHIIALIAQGMVIPKDDVLAAIAQGVLGTDDVIGRTACYDVVEAFYIVQFRTGNRVAEAHDLGLIGFGDVVPATDSHDLAATFRNSLLQGFFQVCRGAALHGAGVDVDIFIGISNGIAGAQDNGGVGIGGHIALADDAVSYAAKFLICARVLVQVQGAQGDRSCAPQVDAGSRTCIHDTGIRTYYGRSNTGGTGFKARCHTSPSRSAVVILIGTEAINLWPFFDRVVLGLYITNSRIHLSYGSRICISFAIFQIGDLILVDTHIAAADGGAIGTQFNLPTGGCGAAGGLITDRSDTFQVFVQADGNVVGIFCL